MKTPKTKNSDELVLVDDVRMEMVLPTSNRPIPDRSVYNYIKDLEIKVVLKKLYGKGRDRRHVSQADAERLLAHFRFLHRHKFKAAQEQK